MYVCEYCMFMYAHAMDTGLYGDGHLNTSIAMQNISFTYHAMGRHEEALAMLDNVIAIRTGP
jgi:Tetratricopeptide repeat